ncbi:MAG: glycosyltransferase [Lachnospiraceae bacterium]|nr:glycosyltransferase [Lachnospiraceae bacterium]
MKKIVLFRGDIETQGYFSEQLATAFTAMGHAVYLFDYEKEGNSALGLPYFIEKGNTVAISFNFHGITNEQLLKDQNGLYIWEAMNIPFYNIVVDHPYYYHTFLQDIPSTYCHISIDAHQDAYMKRFYPEIKRGPILYLGGTSLYPAGDYPRIADRPLDIVFTGNYNNPLDMEQYIQKNGPEYADFYHGMIDELLAHPDLVIEDVIEKHIRREIPEVTDTELKDTMKNLIFIDLYVRYHARGLAVRTLADAGIPVHVYGGNWDLLQEQCKHPENIIWEGELDSLECLQVIAKGKISLNVLPWFKAGPHDRIFNSMLNGAVSLTDSNPVIDSLVTDGKDACIYSLSNIDKLPLIADHLLSHPRLMQEIADAGFQTAQEHTWEARAKVLHKVIEGEE